MTTGPQSRASAPDSGLSSAELRRALGSFATGVTIITTRTADGALVGLTANSFNSVSLNPPLVLWSLANTSRNLGAFRTAEHWAVHVLGTHQEALSARFARSGEDKFAGLDYAEGIGGVPLLDGCSARFQCRTAFHYEGGDHLILVGEVLAFDWTESAPLVFHGGRYARALRTAAATPLEMDAEALEHRPLVELLAQVSRALLADLASALRAEGISVEDYLALAELASGKSCADAEAVRRLRERGLLRPIAHPNDASPDQELSEAGTAALVRLRTAAEAQERARLSDDDAAGAPLKRLLADLADE